MSKVRIETEAESESEPEVAELIPVDPKGDQTLRRALQEEQDRSLRLRADLANFRRRSGQEREAAAREGRRAALLPILDVVDAFERALAVGSTDPVFYEGVASTHRLLLSALRDAGAEPVESLRQPFDPAVHEALNTVRAMGLPAGTVVRELRRGWRLGEELLRPAQVVVTEEAPSPSHTV